METLDFYLTPNGSVLCNSLVPTELLVRLIDIDNELHTFVLPVRKKSKRDLVPPMATSSTEPRFLSVSQILHENTRTHALVKCACCEKKIQKRARYFAHVATNWEDRKSQRTRARGSVSRQVQEIFTRSLNSESAKKL